MNNYQNFDYDNNSCQSGYDQRGNADCDTGICYVRSGDCDACSARGRTYASGRRNCSCGCSRTVCGICSLKAVALFFVLLAFSVGIILGTVYAETFFPALAAIIVFAVIMAVAVIALLIYRHCEC